MMQAGSRCRLALYAGLAVCFFFTNVIKGEESGDYIHYRLGVKYKNENNFDQAVEEFRKVLTAYPDNYNAYMQLAQIRDAQNQPRLVIYNLKKALAYNPGWGKAHRMLAESYEQDKQFQNAIMELQIYQQSCDPAEQESVQKQIDRLIKKVQGKTGPDSVAPVVAQPENKDTAIVKGQKPALAQQKTDQEKKPEKTAAGAAVSHVPKRTAAPALAPAISPAAQALVNKAKILYQQGKIDEALLALKKALQAQPHLAEAFFIGGLARYKQGKPDLAKVNFSKSIQFSGADCQAHFYLGKIYGAEKYFKGAIDELSKFVREAPEGDQKKEALSLLVDYKKLTGDTTAVIAGDNPEKERAEARPDFEPAVPESGFTVIEMRIDSLLSMQIVDTLTDPGQAMLTGVKDFKAGHFDEAIKEFKKVMIAYPGSVVAAPCTYDIGVCYMKLRLFANAENQFDNLRNRYPSHATAAPALFLKAYSYSERGDVTLSEKLFREFIQKYRSHAWTGKAYEKLGDLYLDLKQTGKALDAYNQAVLASKDPADQAYSYFKLGGAYFEAGNSERAVASYKKLIELGESRKLYARVPDSYYKIADYKYQQHDNKTALEFYLKASRKYPAYQETPWALFQTGNIYKNLQNYQKAIETYKELVKNYPDDYWAKQARWKLDDAVWENEYRAVLK